MAWYNFKSEEKKEEPKVLVTAADIFETINMRGLEFPTPKENKAFDWVLFGQHNAFPLEILAYKNSSAIHNAIIEGKVNLICGNGFLFADNRELSNQWIIDNFKLVPFWRKLDKVLWLVTRDQETFGYSCFEIIYSVDHTRIVDINWIDASRIACGKKNSFDQIENYYYCEDWKNTRMYPPRKIDTWDPNNKDSMRQLMFIKYEDNNMDYYCLPNYFPAIKWVKADALMAEYNVSAISNGFSPSIVFKFYKKPTPEERRLNAEMIKAQHSGARNAGKAMIFYSDTKENSPDVDTMDATNIDQRLLQVSDQIIQQIIAAHRSHPGICGIPVPGKLGYSNELLQSFEVMNTMVIKPERKLILDSFKEVLIYNGVSRATIEEVSPIKIIKQ